MSVVIAGIFDFLGTMDGPDFLLLYAVWLLVLRVAVAILRSQDKDHPMITLSGIALFEGLGGLRYWMGSAHGMHRWDFMFLMMILGSVIFVVRAEHFKNSGRGNGGSCSSSSCGGGGGCGGGCGGGGCGGCGGG